MNKKVVLGVLALLVIGCSVLYAQNQTDLRSGVYRPVPVAQGRAMVLIQNTNLRTVKNVIVIRPDGSVHAQGTARINGTRVNVDYGDDGFETWTIVDQEEFNTDDGQATLRKVRDLNNNERNLFRN